MYATITREFRFEAAHQLPNHAGKCRNVHGHSYRVEVEIEGRIRETDGTSSEGMVLDYGDIDLAWENHLKPRLDHQFLNDSIGGGQPTTAENIAVFLLRELAELIGKPEFEGMHHAQGDPPWIKAVTVFETARSSARVER